MTEKKKYRAVMIFGPPGSGKGTQGKVVGALPGFVHLSMGDVFRSLNAKSELGRIFKQYSSQGKLVPDSITIQLWAEHVDRLIAGGGFDAESDVMILDGLPRNPNQAEIIKDYVEPLRLINLQVKDQAQMVARLKRRALLEGRQDDADEDVIRSRFGEYDAETRPVLDCYPSELIYAVEAAQTPLEVLRDVVTGIIESV
jgi:adenylate kinase